LLVVLYEACHDARSLEQKVLKKNSYGYRCLQIDPEGGQGPAWAGQPVNKNLKINYDTGLLNRLHLIAHAIILEFHTVLESLNKE
jgi:hypothetical protein